MLDSWLCNNRKKTEYREATILKRTLGTQTLHLWTGKPWMSANVFFFERLYFLFWKLNYELLDYIVMCRLINYFPSNNTQEVKLYIKDERKAESTRFFFLLRPKLLFFQNRLLDSHGKCQHLESYSLEHAYLIHNMIHYKILIINFFNSKIHSKRL